MLQTDRDDISEAVELDLSPIVPPYGIDLWMVLLALRTEIPRRKLRFSNKMNRPIEVYIPTLKHGFIIEPIRGYIVVRCWKKVKIKMEMEGAGLSIRNLYIIYMFLERMQVNYPKF